MRLFWLSKKRRGRREAPRLSLFPFLAVLICTMGALVLLLLSVTRQARLQAVRLAAAKDAEKQSSIAAEIDMVQWRIDQYKSARKQTEAQLADTRTMLGHVEDHNRRLRSQFQELSERARKAAAEGLRPGRFLSPGDDELRQLEGRIAVAQEQLTQARQAAASKPKSYAIIPYDGPHSTSRRPIYIECRGDAVVLQPENIVFDEADFDEPLGPGNPLAAAVRAAQERMRLQTADPQNAGEPYPLLLVRPDGIAAYDCALAAMKSWGSEFGYELINADWQLKFPPPDPGIARAVNQAVQLARQEHARLIAAAPSKYGKRPRIGSYQASAGGEPQSPQGRGGETVSPGFYSSKPSERYGRGYAAGGVAQRASGGGRASPRFGGGDGSGEGGPGIGDGPGIGGPGRGNGPEGDEEFAANNPYAALPVGGETRSGMPRVGPGGRVAGPGGGTVGPGGATVGPSGGVAGPGGRVAGPTGMGPARAGEPVATSTGVGSPRLPPGGIAAGSTASGGHPGGSAPVAAAVPPPEGYVGGRPADGAPSQNPVRPDPAETAAMMPASPLRPGEWREEVKPPKRDREEEEREKKRKRHPYEKNLPDHNRPDWALRDVSRHAAAITRPVRVDCYPDRVVVVPDLAGAEPHVIHCENDSRRDADKLVAAIWEIMDSWGMAGREMYWRPVLNFYVAPGAEPRLLDYMRSLEGSGLVIERK